MQPSKTGAVICKKKIPGTDQLEYEAVVFISDVPHDVTDSQLAGLVSDRIKVMNVQDCVEVFIRSDINATSNEVWEQFNGFNNDAATGERISYKALL